MFNSRHRNQKNCAFYVLFNRQPPHLRAIMTLWRPQFFGAVFMSALRKSRVTDASSLTKRLETVRSLDKLIGRRRTVPVQPLVNALLAAGYSSLDEQAKALGIHRATAWTIVKNKHKLGCLNQATVSRILANSDTPQSVRVIIEQYLSEKIDIRAKPNMR
jgi:hypothetical protein